MENDMTTRCFLASILAIIVITTAIFVPTATAQGNSHTNPAGKGVPVKSVVEIGSVAASNYDVTITLLETLRGKAAMDRLAAANADNKPPKSGFEYVLARVKFELKGRATSDSKPFDLASSPFQWVAFSSDFNQYESASVIAPKPELKGLVKPGEAAEGWLVFAVEQKESKPVMTFDPASGGATGRGKTVFFRLY
jgi:hypothetical protein